jgi:Cu(I)/Ag(I) efflux system membrane fusion protein
MTMATGQTLAEINGLGTVWLNAAVPEAIAAPLKPGQPVQATLAAFPGETLSGRIAILPETQADSRTLTVRIELPNRGGRLRPGMFATVSLQGNRQPAVLVPTEALIRTGKRTLVMLALDQGRYRPAEVQTGRETDGEPRFSPACRKAKRSSHRDNSSSIPKPACPACRRARSPQPCRL